MKLGQPGQACKAYSELDAVYGAKVRADLKKLEADAKPRRSAARPAMAEKTKRRRWRPTTKLVERFAATSMR
jgi:hypothetical protein